MFAIGEKSGRYSYIDILSYISPQIHMALIDSSAYWQVWKELIVGDKNLISTYRPMTRTAFQPVWLV